jgi:hypothetical protein
MAWQRALVVNLQPPDAHVTDTSNGDALAVEACAEGVVDILACPTRVTAFDDWDDIGWGGQFTFLVAHGHSP